MSWLQPLKFLLLISAVSGGWRKVALDTAPLWSFIMYQSHIPRAGDVLEINILKEFLLRSKDAIIDLTIVLGDDRGWRLEPKHRSAMDKRHLKLAPKLRSIMEEHSHRCGSLMLFGSSNAVVAGTFFPLPLRMSALTDLTIRTDRAFAQWDDPAIQLFPWRMESQLRAMTITTCRLLVIESIDFCRVRPLNLDVSRMSSSDFLQTLSLFRNLRTLDITSVMAPPVGPLPIITMPDIIKITTDHRNHKWVLHSIVAPQLQDSG
jgi:hypothetical protein